MASPTRKIKKIRKAKETAQGARRKRAIRHDRRVKLGCVMPGESAKESKNSESSRE